MSADGDSGFISVSVENIGGISETQVELERGINVLSGENATNRTSFLRALMAALGSNDVSLKADKEEGRVKLTYGDDGPEYTRYLTKRNGSVEFQGEPYSNDTLLPDLFAFLLGDNEARQAVKGGTDLREIITRPIDLQDIETRIKESKRQKRELKDELQRLEELSNALSQKKLEKQQLEEDINSKADALQRKKDELESIDADRSQQLQKRDELEDALSSLNDQREAIESSEYRINTEVESLKALKERQIELAQDFFDHSFPKRNVSNIDERISTIRQERQSMEKKINKLQNLIQINEDMVGDTSDTFIENQMSKNNQSSSTTDPLVTDKTVCWTCGHQVDMEHIAEMVDELRESLHQLVQRRNGMESEIENLQSERNHLQELHQTKQRLEEEIQKNADEIRNRRSKLKDLKDEHDRIEDSIRSLETKVAELERQEESELLEAHSDINQLEFELGRLKESRESLKTEIDDMESEIAKRDEFQDRLEELDDRLVVLRSKVDQIEAEAVDTFNNHMNKLLDILSYENISRIWIDRLQTDDNRAGIEDASQSTFELHVVRTNEEGRGYEDTLDHLSESEREITGLVFALAGYLVHDVFEEVPFILLDSLEAIDSGRIARLVEYFEEYAEFLVIALLPEDAAALSGRHRMITEI